MPEISKIKLPDDSVYDLKDEELRQIISVLFETEESNTNENATVQ